MEERKLESNDNREPEQAPVEGSLLPTEQETAAANGEDVVDEIIREFRSEDERERAEREAKWEPEEDEKGSGAGVPKKWWIIGGSVAALLVVVFAAFCFIASTGKTIAPHTAIGGIDVGGMTRDEAVRTIDPALDTLRTGSGVRTVLEDGAEAAYLSYDELGVVFDAGALADEAYEYSHSGSALIDGWTLFSALLGRHTELTPEPANGWVNSAVEKISEAAALEPTDFSYEVTEENELLMTKGRDGRSVDRAALRERLGESKANADGTRVVDLPYTTVAAGTDDLTQIRDLLGGEMANARYDAETDTIIPERKVLNFDPAQAQALLDAAAQGETVKIPVELGEPTVTAEELRKTLFRDVLGTYTTRVGGAAGRKANVRLTAKRVNGTVLNSGEEFNYYKLTGPFSASNGYQSAPGYQNGKTVQMDGGGACQCSSTTYAAALLANLEIVKRTAHGFASDYIGLGLDATVSGGGPDFIFRNNTPYPIKVQTVYSDDNRLTVKIIGTKTDNTTVKMRTEVLSTTPYQEEYIEDASLAPGQRVVDQTPYVGHTVNTYRQIYDGDGKLISESFEAFSRYNKRNRVIRVAPGESPTAAAPAPSDAPAETPAETPSETPAETPAETPVESPAETPAENTPPAADEQNGSEVTDA